jgi:hypothetical protein
MEATDLAATALTGAGGVGGGCAIAWLLLKAWIAERSSRMGALEVRVTDLQDKELREIRAEVQTVRGNCMLHREDKSVASIQAAIGALDKTVTRTEAKVDGLIVDVATVKEKTLGNEGFIRDVRSEIRDHKQQAHGGQQ